jgi:hypothetical protein
MDIKIQLETVEPPEGRIGRDGHRDWLPFIGWLELISALERLLEAAKRPLPRALFEAKTEEQT